MVIYRLSLTVL